MEVDGGITISFIVFCVKPALRINKERNSINIIRRIISYL